MVSARHRTPEIISCLLSICVLNLRTFMGCGDSSREIPEQWFPLESTNTRLCRGKTVSRGSSACSGITFWMAGNQSLPCCLCIGSLQTVHPV